MSLICNVTHVQRRTQCNSITHTLTQLRDLRLQDQLLAVPKQSKDSPNRNRYLLHGGQVTHVPTTPLAAMRAAVTRPVIAGLLNDIFMAQRRGGKGIGDSDGDDESVRSFFTRRFNAHVADALVGAFVNGIYGGDVGRVGGIFC